MKKISKIVFSGLAGVALLSAVSFYFYDKSQNSKNLFKELYKTVFLDKKASFFQVKKIINQCFNFYLGRYLLKNNQNLVYSCELNKRFCQNVIQVGQYFYECLDCSKIIQNCTYDQQEIESQFEYSHRICEDCFEHEKHVGHKYKFIQQVSGQYLCDCGFSYFFNQESFCKSHKGFKDARQQYMLLHNQEIRSRTIQYFKELFNILFDGQQKLSDKKQREDKAKEYHSSLLLDSNLFNSYNFVMEQILNQINEVIDIQDHLVFAIALVFKENLNVENQIEFNFFDEQIVINQNIFEWILLYQTSLNQSNQILLNKVLLTISQADETFLEFISEKFMKFMCCSVIKQNTVDGQITFRVRRLFNLCKRAICNEQFAEKLCQQNQKQVLNNLILFQKILKQISVLNEENFNTSENIFFYVSHLFKSVNSIESFQQLDKLIETFLDILFICYKKTSIDLTPNKMTILQNFIQNISIIEFYIQIQSGLINILSEITSFSQKGLSECKKKTILRTLCQRYKLFIEQTCIEIEFNKIQINTQHKVYLGISISSLIIFIVILSEGTELATQNIINAIQKNFQFDDEEQYNQFLNKIAEIIQSNIIFCYDHKSGDLLNVLSIQFEGDVEFKTYLDQILACLLRSDFAIYDLNTLTFQLIALILKNNDKPTFKFVSQFQLEYLHNRSYENIFIFKNKFLITNALLLDQTPLININRKLKYILSQGKSDMEEQINMCAKQDKDSTIKWQPSLTNSYNLFTDKVSYCISDVKLIQKNLKEFGMFQVNEDILNIQSLNNLETTNINLARFFFDESAPDKNVVSKIGFIKHLYKYQIELLINCFFNVDLLQSFKNLYSKLFINDILKLFSAFDFYFFFWAEVIRLVEKNPQIVNSAQFEKINEFKNKFISKENYEIFYPKLNHIEKYFQQNRQDQKPLCLFVIKLFEEQKNDLK
ncbi:hypothetical protein ABPG72_001601 [Tetrahymena utriculariae]